MNDKETVLMRIVDAVVLCCATQIDEAGNMSVTKEDVLGKSRAENAVMTRCILVDQLIMAGFTKATAALLLKRSVRAVRDMLLMGRNFHDQSRAYRIAEAEATIKCKDITL